MVKVVVTSAPRTGFPSFVIRTANAFGTAALFGSTVSSSRYGPLSTTLTTLPGPTCALARPSEASAFGGGGRLESTAAAKIAPATSSTSPPTSRRRSRAAPGPTSAACSAGFVRSRFAAASTSAVASSPIFAISAWP